MEIKIIAETIDKCLSKARIREKLSAMTQEEKNNALTDKMNPFEKKDYELLQYNIKRNRKSIESAKESDMDLTNYIQRTEKKIEEYEEQIFDYERRIIQGYDLSPSKEMPNINELIKDFNRDYKDYDSSWDEDIGWIEHSQLEKQSDVDFSENEVNSLIEWHGEGHSYINDSIYKNEKFMDDIADLDDEDKEYYFRDLNRTKSNISKGINKTDGLVVNAILYHGGDNFDIHSRVGDHINFKGFLSTSFDEDIAKDYGDYTYVLLTPKGKKGVCMNTEGFDIFTWEHEYLMGRNTGGDIVHINYDTNEIYVLVDT